MACEVCGSGWGSPDPRGLRPGCATSAGLRKVARRRRRGPSGLRRQVAGGGQGDRRSAETGRPGSPTGTWAPDPWGFSLPCMVLGPPGRRLLCLPVPCPPVLCPRVLCPLSFCLLSSCTVSSCPLYSILLSSVLLSPVLLSSVLLSPVPCPPAAELTHQLYLPKAEAQGLQRDPANPERKVRFCSRTGKEAETSAKHSLSAPRGLLLSGARPQRGREDGARSVSSWEPVG